MGPRSYNLCRSLLLLLLLLLLLPAGCFGAEGRLAHKLFRDLFTNYTSALRPVADTDQTLNVTLEVTLSQIIDMDERNQVLTLYLWIRQEWTDAYLRWDPDAYGGLNAIRIPSSLPYADVTFTLLLRRRAAAYVCNLLLPCVLISLLAPLAFHLPADSGEKVSLGVTVLLALTVFQLLLAESMPPAESVPLIGKYYMATMTMVTFSTALTILIMNLHYCGPSARPVPAWARALLLGHLAKGLCVRERGEPCGQPRPPEPAPSPQPPAGLPAGPCHEPRCLCYQEALLHHVATIASTFRSHWEAQHRQEDWKRLALVMDRFFLGIFFSMALVMSLLVLVQAL
ncbi:Neuronal acetylcholine receptor subunit alpha-10 [Fukomys damarensis]|uniref:Neuronal acetylcholine receptor subunit alpha-10 n=1 Tax=Fukomys damarensis TaxID=885580 RepID=A0A091CZ35_FUKDA|nr:Neuronal acetylcholine receptor subunit alpha-10 [Fukomys damarensis]